MALKSSRVALKNSSQPSYIGFNVHMCILGERRQRAGASSKTEGNALTSALPSSLYTTSGFIPCTIQLGDYGVQNALC